MVRYPVGQPIPPAIYTTPFENDGIYKFIQTNFGDPNIPKIQAAPDDWIAKFGNNERTLILYAISDLRANVALQARRLMALEKLAKPVDGTQKSDPNEGTIIDNKSKM